MAKDKLTDYDSTAANNLDVGGISVAEGMLPSGVNNAIREQMSHLADFAAGTSGVDVLKLQDDTDTNSIKLQAPASVTATTTFTLPDGDGASGQTMITDGAGTLSWAAPYGNRNLIINGAMQVAQRGTSSTSTGYQTVDRFQTNTLNASTLAFTQSQSTDSPSGFSNSYKVTVDTAESSPVSNFAFRVIYENEAQNIQNLAYGTSDAKTVTISFWVKSNVTGTYTLSAYQWDDNRAITTDYTISSANTWEYKTVTISADTVGVIDNDNGAGLRLNFMLDAGSTYKVTASSWQTYANQLASANHNSDFSDTVNNYWQITGVQLEVGETATPFEHRSYGDELARCQRYYEPHNLLQIVSPSTDLNTNSYWTGFFHITKRANPTISVTGTWSNSTPVLDGVSVDAYRISSTSAFYSNSTGNIVADAEL